MTQKPPRPERPEPPHYAEALKPYLAGLRPLPNYEPISHEEFLRTLSSVGHSLDQRWGRARLPGETGYVSWTMFYLSHVGMSVSEDSLGGAGYFVRYESVGRRELIDCQCSAADLCPQGRVGAQRRCQIWRSRGPITGRFALCKHEQVLTAGANPSRGWRPGYCKHCGIDMTIDSGD